MKIKINEIWKNIAGYTNYYQISDLGNVKSLSRKDSIRHNLKEKVLKFGLGRSGYYSVNLCKNSNVKQFQVHRLVAQTFILNPDNKPEVNHKNGVKINNRVENLEWVTSKENSKHADIILNINRRGENYGNVVLKEVNVIQIRNSNLKQKELAKIFKVSRQHISAIKLKKVWKHI